MKVRFVDGIPNFESQMFKTCGVGCLCRLNTATVLDSYFSDGAKSHAGNVGDGFHSCCVHDGRN
jgi:hypothetical protein